MSKEQAVVKTPQPGDTVDPRTLPVGAELHLPGSTWTRWVISAPGRVKSLANGFEVALVSSKCTLLSLPTPKRPPCEACGEESCPACSYYIVDGQQSPLCNACWVISSVELTATIRKRRAAQTSPERPIVRPMSAPSENPPRKNTDPSSLPTYDQIAGWLGAEWVMTYPGFKTEVPPKWAPEFQRRFPSPWHRDGTRCYLRHTSGQRVEVTAPSRPVESATWWAWFSHIRCGLRTNEGNGYSKHVRWLDPDTKTSAGSDADASEFIRAEAEGPSSEPVVPPRCSSCGQAFWAGRTEAPLQPQEGGPVCGDCHANGCGLDLRRPLDTRIAEVRPEPVRIEDMPGAWQTPCAEGES